MKTTKKNQFERDNTNDQKNFNAMIFDAIVVQTNSIVIIKKSKISKFNRRSFEIITFNKQLSTIIRKIFDDNRKKQKSTHLNDYELDLTFQKKFIIEKKNENDNEKIENQN